MKETSASTTSEAIDDDPQRCAVCGDRSEYMSDWLGSAPNCEEDDPGEDEHYRLRRWTRSIVHSPFGRHDTCGFTGHVYGKLDRHHPLFKEFWSEHTTPLDFETDRIEECPQCKDKGMRTSSDLFQEDHFELLSFKCYVCSKGCVSCYVLTFVSGMAADMGGMTDEDFKERAKGSRIDLCAPDADCPKLRKRKRPCDDDASVKDPRTEDEIDLDDVT